MNSLGATPRVKYIYEDLKDGLAMIQVRDDTGVCVFV